MNTIIPNQRTLIQWGAIALVGAALGVATIGASVLPGKPGLLLLLAVLAPLLAMVVGDVRRLLLAAIMLDIPLQLDVYLWYRPEAAALGAIGGLNISVTTAALLGLYGLWIVERLAKVRRPVPASFRPALPLGLYLGFAALSAVAARDAMLTLFELFMLTQMFLLFIYVVSTVRTREEVLILVTMLLIGLILESLLMMAGAALGRDFNLVGASSGDGGTYSGGFFRPGGTFGAPNPAATYLRLLLAPAIGLVLARTGRWHRRLAAVASSLGGLALLLTLSRGGWAAAALSIVILCFFAWRRGWLSPAVPFAIALVVVLMAVVFQDLIVGRLFGDDASSAESRVPLMQLAFRAIEDHPLLGVGASNFAVVVKQYITPEFAQEWIYSVHNHYLLVWSETGPGGLLAFLLFLGVTLHRGWQVFRRSDRLLSPLALGFTAAIVGHLGHMFVDLFNSRALVQLLWLIAALIAAMHAINPEQDLTGLRKPVRSLPRPPGTLPLPSGASQVPQQAS
ncbi:MAG TPA: O-antigen ligase family protein [Ardenticatenaceae bacterium]|nr:O-antigen ligase family protein [Ardenticatenaceae bacterium]